MVFSKNYSILIKNICFEAIQNECKLKQSALGLNRGMSSNVVCLKSTNNVKFTEESAMCVEKLFF